MKRKITKLLFAISITLAFAFNVSSQDVSAPCFTKTHEELIGFKPIGMSDNGRFIVCNNGTSTRGNTCKLWDTETNVVTTLGENCWGRDVTNDGKIVVGQFENLDISFGPSSFELSAGYHNGEKWIKVDNLEGVEPAKGKNGYIYQVSLDGKFFGGYLPYNGSKNGTLISTVWDGTTGKVLHTFNGSKNPLHKDYKTAMRAMSDDGKRCAGWSTRVGDYYSGGTWIPSFWTSRDDDALHIQGVAGTFEGMDNAGTVAVGNISNEGTGLIMKEDGTIIKTGTGFSSVSETGRVAGAEIYDESMGGLWTLSDFFNLYGLSIESPWYVVGISDNGEYLALMQRFGSVAAGTVLVRISGGPLPTTPGNVILMGGAENSVNISWGAARFNGHTPIGYNVYRNGIKINESPIDALTYNDTEPRIGKNSYAVTAVYQYRPEEPVKESEKTEEKSIEVLFETGCYHPKNLEVVVEYNRTVNLSWGNPFPTYDKSSEADGGSKEMIKLKPNILKTFDDMGGAVHSATDGDVIYTCSAFGGFSKFSIDGKSLGAINVKPASTYRGVAHDGEKLYSTALVSNNYNIIVINDDGTTTTMALDNDIKSLTRISYLPFLNGGKGGFEIGAFADEGTIGTSLYVDREGKKLTGNGSLPQKKAIMGVTSYEDIIYVATRENNTTTDMKIYLYDAATSTPRNEYIDLRDYPNLQLGQTDQIWGISAITSTEGIPCLTVLVGTSAKSRMVFLQLAPMKGLKGYNVWKNDIKLTAEPIETTYFTEKIFDAGSYEYNVTAVFDNDCESSKSNTANVTISPIGTVNSPRNITTEAIRNNIIVSWEAPKASVSPKMVGYNVFRNGVQVNPIGEYMTELFYTDKDLALGDYKYEVNAFYNNSGESDKIANNFKLVGFNPMLAPAKLALKEGDKGSVDLTWKTPAMGDYEVMSWHNGNIEDCIGVSKEGGILYVATKWDEKDLSSIFNYTLTDIEFYAGNSITYTFYIYVDNKLVGEQIVEKAKAKDYNLVKLNKPIAIEKGKPLMVVCKVTHGEKELPIGISKRNNAVGKGDLTSTDGKNWVSVYESENFKATWAISARFMPYTLETPTEIVGVEMEVNNDKNHQIVGGAAMMRNAATALFKNSEVIGYNVYKNNEKINSSVVNTEEFKDSSVDLTKDNCYSVEALFTADRTSPKSEEVCTFGLCAIPIFTAKIEGSYPELTVMAPTETVTKEDIKYYGEEGVSSIGFGTKDPYWTLLSLKPTDLQEYDGFKISKIKAFIANNDFSVSLFAKQGDKVILNQAIKKSDIQIGSNEWEVTSDVTIDKNSGLLVGLKITAQVNKFTVSIDDGQAIEFKSNVISLDEGVTCMSLSEVTKGKLTGNWNIGLSLEKTLPLEETCLGYNIYRNGVKINDEPVTYELYVDKSAEGNTTYVYHATAVWDTKCESKASMKVELTTPVGVTDLASANIKVYPNPAKDMLHIEGDIDAVRFYNTVGQECRRQKAEDGKLSVDVSNWAKGIYIIEITSTTGEVNRGKVIIK